MEFSKGFKSQCFVCGFSCLLKPQELALKTLSFPTAKKNPFPVMSCSFREEIAALKESLVEASVGKTFVVCTGDPHSFSIRNFLLLQVLAMVVPGLSEMSVCKIFNMGYQNEDFEFSYSFLKRLHKYDVKFWKEELNIAWKKYDHCAIENETRFLRSLKYVQDMSRFYVARYPLHLQPNIPAQECYYYFSHLLFVDEECSDFEYLQHTRNPKALKLTQSSDIDHIISACKVLNPKQQRGNIVIVIKLSPPLLHDLDGYIRKMKKEEIAVTWLLDPLVTVAKGDAMITWSLKKSLEKVRPIIFTLARIGYRFGGFYMETTGDESECKLYEETTMEKQARLDVELSLAVLEDVTYRHLSWGLDED